MIFFLLLFLNISCRIYLFLKLNSDYFGLTANTTLIWFLFAISQTLTAFSIGTPSSALKTMALVLSAENNDNNFDSNSVSDTGSLSMKNSSFLLMLTAIFLLLSVFPFALGSTKSKAFVVTMVDVSIKNISNKNTMSVIDDILNSALTLFRPLKFISRLCLFFIAITHAVKVMTVFFWSSGFHKLCRIV